MGLDLILNLGAKIIDKVFPDPAKKAEATLKLMELQQAGELASMSAQTDINKIEAASPKIFIAGWRPFVGWTCGVGLAIQFIVGPIGEWASALIGHPTPFPKLDIQPLMAMLAAMLGLVGARTFEKVKGAEGNR
jgi:holin (3TMs family)